MTFPPNDTVDYSPVITQATLLVAKAVPQITWLQPASIVTGTALTSKQLVATASVPGNFSYVPPSGTVLRAGTYNLQVTFTATDTADYVTTQAVVSLTVKSH